MNSGGPHGKGIGGWSESGASKAGLGGGCEGEYAKIFYFCVCTIFSSILDIVYYDQA
jgi:hypothetical protein